MTAQATKASIDEMPFEAAMKELESIIARLEGGSISLAESISAYERGELLKNRCALLLKQAEMRVEKIKANAEGKAEGATKFDLEDKA